MTQSSGGQLYIVALTLADLYRTYDNMKGMDDGVRKAVLSSIQGRWKDKNTDQEAFILSVILNPYIRESHFNPKSEYSTPPGIYNLVTRMWKRIYRCEPEESLETVVGDYIHRRDQFSDDEMQLDYHKRHLNSVRAQLAGLLQPDPLTGRSSQYPGRLEGY